MKKGFKIPVIDIQQYGGRQVAIVGGKIVASGTNTKEVINLARKHLPKSTWRDILLVNVPTGLTVVYKI
jgi:hypothetical protein